MEMAAAAEKGTSDRIGAAGGERERGGGERRRWPHNLQLKQKPSLFLLARSYLLVTAPRSLDRQVALPHSFLPSFTGSHGGGEGRSQLTKGVLREKERDSATTNKQTPHTAAIPMSLGMDAIMTRRFSHVN